MLFLDVLTYPLVCALMPRFIIGIRASYDRDRVKRWQGIDTGFGVCSQSAGGDVIGLEEDRGGNGGGLEVRVDGETV